MIANICPTVLGIWLVYATVLNPSLVGATNSGAAAGLVAALLLIVLAFIARRSDDDPWHTSVGLILGAILACEKAIELSLGLPAEVRFWVTFWVGILSAVSALWALLYRPLPSPQ